MMKLDDKTFKYLQSAKKNKAIAKSQKVCSSYSHQENDSLLFNIELDLPSQTFCGSFQDERAAYWKAFLLPPLPPNNKNIQHAPKKKEGLFTFIFIHPFRVGSHKYGLFQVYGRVEAGINANIRHGSLLNADVSRLSK